MEELALQRAQRTHVNALYTSLLTADPALGKKALSAQSVQHVHRALFECLEHAKEDGLITANPCAGAKRPAVPSATQVVLNQERMAAFLQGLAPRVATGEEKARRRWRMTDANRAFLYWLSTLAACTGMRRGEILALRRSDVDLDAGVVHVRRALTQTRTFGVGVKLPKTNRGRTVNIPPQLCTMLAQYRRDHKELWLLLGARPKAEADALLLPGSPDRPDEVCKPNLASKRFSSCVASVDLEGLKLHGLRHSHASQLVALGYGMADRAKTLGHSSPATTMRIYAHALEGAQPRMAAEMGLMLERAAR